MAFILTTLYLSVQFNIFYEVKHTPVIDSGMDYINTAKNIVILPAALVDIHKMLGIMDKTVIATPREYAEVYLPRWFTKSESS